MPIPEIKYHIGRKIVRIRELRGIKQETLASALGVSQQAVSKMEQSEKMDEENLKKVAKALGVSTDAIKHFNEEAVLNLIQNNSDHSTNNSLIAYQFNQMDKLIEVLEENKKLYERLLQSEREKNELLETILRNNGTIK